LSEEEEDDEFETEMTCTVERELKTREGFEA